MTAAPSTERAHLGAPDENASSKPSFAKRLRQIQTERGIKTDQAFAALIGCTRSTMNAYFNGHSAPRGAAAYRIASLLGVDVDWLFPTEQSSAPPAASLLVSGEQDVAALDRRRIFCLAVAQELFSLDPEFAHRVPHTVLVARIDAVLTAYALTLSNSSAGGAS